MIVLTGQNDRANALKAIGLGAADFFAKPFEADLLGIVVDRAFRLSDLERENRQLLAKQASETPLDGLLTRDPGMLKVCRLVERVAPTTATVLLLGESGTGKEVLARALHELSARRDKRFVAINCAAIPENLLESELFGHEKGAFTGAIKQTLGKIEVADGGTLFLDEIGDLPLEAQASLLRFLQESTITRVGSTQLLKLDVRVVAATHVDLVAAVRERHFREDLFYRLNVLRVEIPPLRVRGDDIETHARHVLARYRRDASPALLGFSEEALAAMRSHSWPGNVRELVNRVHGAMILCEGAWITPADLGLDSAPRSIGAISLAGARQSSERELVLAALQRNTHNVSATARELGVSRVTLYRLARRLSIETKAKPERPARGQTLGGYG